jgi:3-hydroxyisobutyrate dehydrogenase-like beta-hydroxyacid dehydrogenase
MNHVSVIGLGAMGSALARALLGAGHSVTVWNRTASSMGPLVALGANDATSVADAVQASSMVLVCVDNYSVTRSLLDIGDVTPHLSGRTLIQLSTGTPREARESEGWASKHGAGYLDGAILGLPRLLLMLRDQHSNALRATSAMSVKRSAQPRRWT